MALLACALSLLAAALLLTPPSPNSPCSSRASISHLTSSLRLLLSMLLAALYSLFPRVLARLLFLPASVCYFDVASKPGVQGLVALTIDDAICGGEKRHALVDQVRQILAQWQATATFFCTLSFCQGEWRGASGRGGEKNMASGSHCPLF